MRIFLLSLFLGLVLETPIVLAEQKSEQMSVEAEKNMEISRKNLQSVVSENSFFSDEPAVIRPNCDDARLNQQVLTRIKEYFSKNQEISIYDKRRQTLLLKKLDEFMPIQITEFKPEDNYAVADRLIDIKINGGIAESKISLCRSGHGENIYLLIYPANSFYTVEIVNFPGQKNSKDFKLAYE